MSDFPSSDNNGFPDINDEEPYFIQDQPKFGNGGIVFTQEQRDYIREMIRQVLVENNLIEPAAEDE